jgi:hypothetical protein
MFLFASCSAPVTQTWSDTGRFSISPVAWGLSLWSKQNTLSLSGSDGKVLWSKEYTDLKWIRTLNFAGKLIVVGDDRIIENIDRKGKTLWRWSVPPKQLVYPFATGNGKLICAVDTDTDYNQNPISLMALNIKDGSVSWTLEDHDYSGALTLEPLESNIAHIVVPSIVGDSIFLECFSCSDGKFIWRKNWNKPPSGQHPILASDALDCLIWSKTPTGIEVGFVNRKSGVIKTTKLAESTSAVKKLYSNGNLFLRFKSGICYRLDKFLNYKQTPNEWFPICNIPGDNTYLAQNNDCTYLAIVDKDLTNIQKALKTTVCYTGISGVGFGEAYLKPMLSPLDYQAIRCIAVSKQQQRLFEIPKIFSRLGKGAKLTDLYLILQPLGN